MGKIMVTYSGWNMLPVISGLSLNVLQSKHDLQMQYTKLHANRHTTQMVSTMHCASPIIKLCQTYPPMSHAILLPEAITLIIKNYKMIRWCLSQQIKWQLKLCNVWISCSLDQQIVQQKVHTCYHEWCSKSCICEDFFSDNLIFRLVCTCC